MNNDHKIEFSRIVKIEDSKLNKNFSITADDAEQEALAHRLCIHSVNALHLDYIITKKEDIDGAFVLIGKLTSNITKFVIDSYEEITEIKEEFEVALISEEMAEANLEILKEWDIEILDESKVIDIGEIASQYLSLCIFM